MHVSETIPLTDNNFLIYAAQHYNNPYCYSNDEFYEDIQRIENLKKLFKRLRNGILQNKQEDKLHKLIRILLNNVITFNNVFEIRAVPRLLFFKIPEYHSELKTILTFLNIMPDRLFNLGEVEIIHSSDIPVHSILADYLRKI